MTQGNAGRSSSPANVSESPPLDLVHLGRATLGDPTLCREVLALFVDQALLFRHQVGRASIPERLRLAHTLKGSARGVGAFPLAAGVAALEQQPADEAVLSALSVLIDEVCAFIAER